jgi:hypothetical protein
MAKVTHAAPLEVRGAGVGGVSQAGLAVGRKGGGQVFVCERCVCVGGGGNKGRAVGRRGGCLYAGCGGCAKVTHS